MTTIHAPALATGTWRLDRSRSTVEFHVPVLRGLMTVKGGFDRYDGTLDVSGRPAVALDIDAESLNTHIQRRDTHLRSEDFFDVANHPRVRFEADGVELDGDALKVRGLVYAAGKHVRVEADATVRAVDDEFEIEASARIDQRQLGMTWRALGIVGTPSTLIVRGRLVRAEI